MNVLWEQGSATVHETRDLMDDPPHYTSVLTVFQRLEEQGHVRHEKEGRAYRYYPTLEREEVETSVLSHLMSRLFKGSPRRLINALVDTGAVDREEIERLKRVLDEAASG